MHSFRRFSAITLVLLGIAGSISGTATQAAASARDVAKLAFRSTVLIVMQDGTGQPVSLGSGLVVSDNVVATNLHVVEGATTGTVKVVGSRGAAKILGHRGIDEAHDLVLLQTESLQAPALAIAKSDTLAVGDAVYAVGNPQGLEGTFSEGIVSAVRGADADRLLQITAPISPGSSGGPVLDEDGKVIGVAVATFKDGQNLNFAVPSSYLSALVEKHSPLELLKPTGSAKQRSSPSAVPGSKVTTGVTASQFAWTDNQFMGKYTFSVRNELDEPVYGVVCLVIFYGSDGKPVETEEVTIRDTIGPKLAKRTDEKGRIGADQVRKFTKRTEIRVLDFRVGEGRRRR